jgi:hypothetical protein
MGVLEGGTGGLAVAKVAMRKARVAVADDTHFEKF